MEDKSVREGIEGLIVLLACLTFATGVGLVTHSIGWALMALPLAFGVVRYVRAQT